MKFFNWMSRKPHQSTDYSLVSFNTKAEVHNGDRQAKATEDTETLLNHMLNGILTIGTLGHDNFSALSPIIEEDQLAALEVEAELEVETKASPVPVAAPAPAPAPVLITSLSTKEKAIEMARMEEPNRPSCEIIEPLLDKEAISSRRTTLVELFAIEEAKTKPKKKNVPAVEQKTGKKDLPKGKDHPPPPGITKKLQRLMTKMMKKKIHPDMGQARSGPSDGRNAEQGRFSPNAIRATIGACYGATGHIAEVNWNPHGNEAVGKEF